MRFLITPIIYQCRCIFYLCSRFGRKRALLFSVVPYLIGWVLIATAKTLVQLFIARIIFGIALAIDYTIVPMYCGEIAEVSTTKIMYSVENY